MKTLGCWIAAALFLGADAKKDENIYSLTEKIAVGDQIEYNVHLAIRGKIRSGEKEENLAGQAKLVYPEKVLEVAPDGMPGKVVRVYNDARAKFVVGHAEDSRQLRGQVRFMVGDRKDLGYTLWSPSGPLSGDERELVEDVMDAGRLTGLLSADPVQIGATWKPDPSIIKSLCDIDEVTECTVQSKLDVVEHGKAIVKVTGSVSGLAFGAEVKSKIDATLTVDADTGMLEDADWTQTDTRGPGAISPAGEFEVKIAVHRKRTRSEALSDTALKEVSLNAGPGSTLISFEEPQGRYRFYYPREWHVTAVRPDLVILRKLGGEQFVAQLNVTVVNDRKAGTEMNTDEFESLIEKASGFQIEEIIRSAKVPNEQNLEVQMISAVGSNGKTKLAQRHFLATATNGRQLAFSFVMEPANEERLGTDDLSLVSSVEFLYPVLDAAEKETEEQKK